MSREAVARFSKGQEEHVLRMYTALGSGWVPKLARALLTAGRSVGIEKPGKPEPRALGMGSNLLLPLIRHLAKSLVTAVGKKCKPEQFGGGLPCGADAIAFAVRVCLSEHPDWVIAHADLKNAFGAFCRAAILRAARDAGSAALPFIAGELRSPGYGVVVGSDGEIGLVLNREGVVQGAPNSPPLFCLGFDRALKATRAAHPNVIILAIADDSFLLGTRENVAACLATLEMEVSKDNLTLQPTKTAFYSPSEATRGALHADVAAGRLAGRVQDEGIVVAGIPISRTRGFTEAFVEKRLLETGKLVLQVSHCKPSVAVAIYRTCIQPMWEHLYRSGCLMGMEQGGRMQKLEQIEGAFGDWVCSFNSRLYEANGDLLRAEVIRHQRKAPLAQGGVELALIPDRLPRIARFAGMVLDVVPGLVGLANKHGLDFMGGIALLEEATVAPVPTQSNSYGFHSDPALKVADWAVRWVWD